VSPVKVEERVVAELCCAAPPAAPYSQVCRLAQTRVGDSGRAAEGLGGREASRADGRVEARDRSRWNGMERRQSDETVSDRFGW
jgi:hypothetical protein